MWHPSLFGFNWPGSGGDAVQNYNTNAAATPLRQSRNLTTDEWFRRFHSAPPTEGAFLELQAGKTSTFELSCNRAHTTYGHPGMANQPKMAFACRTVQPLHNGGDNSFDTAYEQLDRQQFGGTAIGIAYTDDITAVQPEDFTIITVNHTSPWFRLTDYTIPKDLPPCPENGCLCTWSWIHTIGTEFVSDCVNCLTIVQQCVSLQGHWRDERECGQHCVPPPGACQV